MPKGSAYEGFSALYDSAETVQVREPVQTKCVVEYELVQLVQDHGDRPHRGTPLGRFPELYPFDLLKRLLKAHADEFVSQLAKKGYGLIGQVDQLKVWGPYTEKVGDLRPWRPEEGNHTIAKQDQRTAQKVWGYQGDEIRFDKGCAFLIQGQFTRSTADGAIDEATGRIYL